MHDSDEIRMKEALNRCKLLVQFGVGLDIHDLCKVAEDFGVDRRDLFDAYLESE